MGKLTAEVTALNEEGDAKPQVNKNGKKGGAVGGASFFTWFMILALLGVWTSVAVVYFDLVDYQKVIGKLSPYDADGDGDFDVEDAKVLLEEKPGDLSKKREPHAKDVGLRLREALKEQLNIIHERVEARKIAKMALAEVRSILAKEQEEKVLERIREESALKAWERAETRLREQGEAIEREDVDKAMEKIRREKQERERNASMLKTPGEEQEKKEIPEKKNPDGASEDGTPEREEKEVKKSRRKP